VESCPGPVAVADLPWEYLGNLDTASRSTDGNLRVITFGHVNANKRVASVIRAIATSESLRKRVVYKVLGPIEAEMARGLSSLAHGLGVSMVLSGEVDDSVLSDELAHSDIVVALRWPCLEAASASVIEAMLAGKPIVVTRAGFYDELPDNCVVKIDHDDEIPQLALALERLTESPARRVELADNARHWAVPRFSTSRYADRLVGLSRQALSHFPEWDAYSRAAEVLAAWGFDRPTDIDQYVFPPMRLAARPEARPA
jgi:glycosyltransferase involved in cell wall biosynthesis